MNINGNNYEFKMGQRALRVLKEDYNLSLETMQFDFPDMVKLIHAGLKGYAGYKGTLEELEDAIDDDISIFKQADGVVAAYLEKMLEPRAEAKN